MSEISVDQAMIMVADSLGAGDQAAAKGLGEQITGYAVSRLVGGDVAEAEAILDRMSELLPCDPSVLLYRGLCRQYLGDMAGAEALIRRSLALAPDRADAWCNLGVALLAQDDVDQSVDCFRRALRRDDGNRHALNNLGIALLKRRDWDLARDILTASYHHGDGDAGVHTNLALARLRTGDAEGALSLCDQVLAVDSGNVDALIFRAEALKTGGDIAGAIASLRQAVAIDGGIPARNNLAGMLEATGGVLEAEAIFRSIIATQPANAEVWANLSKTLATLGRMEEASAACQTSLRLAPSDRVHSNLVLLRQLQAGSTGRSLLAEAKSWADNHGKAGRCMYLNEPEPERRLRIGYLSPDFRRHAAAYFLRPLVEGHDRNNVEIYCYYTHDEQDDMTAAFRDAADQWRPSASLDDIRLAALVQADGIDILVDCAGHTAGGRLAALACKPAPVMITTLLGHGGSTGLPAMDYILADSAMIPPDAHGDFSETVLPLPVFAPFWADPAWPQPWPPVARPPVLACFGAPQRIGDDLLGLMRRCLDRLPEARLLLKNPAYGDEALRTYWLDRFALLGDRLMLEDVPGGWGRNMEVYGRIDVVLDTFPAHGASTSLIPLWMGIPVVSLTGGHSGQRFGASILAAAGLDDLAAAGPEEFVDKVVSLALDRSRLADLRRTLRGRLAASPFGDHAGMVREVENAYRAVWRRWCRTGGAEGFHLGRDLL